MDGERGKDVCGAGMRKNKTNKTKIHTSSTMCSAVTLSDPEQDPYLPFLSQADVWASQRLKSATVVSHITAKPQSYTAAHYVNTK